MKKLTKLVIATRNNGKVNYYKPILEHIADIVIGLDEIGIESKPIETGNTAEENSMIKATFYCGKTGLPVFSEDEALYVDFLPKSKQPGVQVRRINGKDEVDDGKLLEHWEKVIANVPKEKRTGYWRIAYCIATPDENYKTVCRNHKIMFFSPPSKTIIPGWPLSSIQGNIEFKKPHSEQTEDEREIARNRGKKELEKLLADLV